VLDAESLESLSIDFTELSADMPLSVNGLLTALAIASVLTPESVKYLAKSITAVSDIALSSSGNDAPALTALADSEL